MERFEIRPAHPEPACPGGPKHLMAREAEVVAPDGGDVDRDVRGRLGSVDEELCAPVAADPGDLPDGEDGAEDI